MEYNQGASLKTKVLWAFLGLLFVGLVGGGVYAWQSHLAAGEREELQEEISSLLRKVKGGQEQEDTEAIAALATALGSDVKFKISLTVPKAWRATLDDTEPPYRFDNANSTLAIFQFVPSPGNPYQPDTILPKNKLSFYNVTEWAKQDSAGGPSPAKAKDKQAYFDFLVNLGKEGAFKDFTGCTPVFNSCGGLHPIYIESSDQQLSGFAVLRLSNQSMEYTPGVYIYMAGVVEGKILYAEGVFALYDETYKQLYAATPATEDVAKARDQLAKELPTDTEKIYRSILDAVQTAKVEVVK